MKIIKTGLIAVLALGGLLALTNVASAQDAKEGKKGRAMSPEARLERMTKDLNLTDAQKPKVKAVIEESGKKMADLRDVSDRSERREKMRAIMEDENKKLKEILTPEQYEKHLKMEQERRGRKKGEGKGDEKKQN